MILISCQKITCSISPGLHAWEKGLLVDRENQWLSTADDVHDALHEAPGLSFVVKLSSAKRASLKSCLRGKTRSA